MKKSKTEVNKELIIKVLTNVEFRNLMETNPASALGVKVLTKENQREVQKILTTVKMITARINEAADELLCAYGPEPCGIG